jgi:16S rRNA (cytidine1402-2'-O)-methyltransferase
MLSFIPTPIGNKDDITVRALKLLENVSVLFCEDTRTTIKLLRMYDIEWKTKQLYSLTSYTPEHKIDEYISLVKEQDCGVVSEA